MIVRHLNAATFCPVSARLVNGSGGLFARARMVCHVLVVESDDGLVLVDTGLGEDDVAQPARLGSMWLRMVAPRLDPAETAVAQLRHLGYAAADVRHVVPTHLDLDHAGGLADFPSATVHVHRREHAAAMARSNAVERRRYVPGHWSHGPSWQIHDDGGETWFGFAGVRALSERTPDILLVPLRGHSAGHTGVAVRTGDGWLLHAGDAYYHRGQIDSAGRAPLVLRVLQRQSDTDRAERIANQERLRALRAGHPEVTVFCAHDPVELDTLAAVTAGHSRAADPTGT